MNCNSFARISPDDAISWAFVVGRRTLPGRHPPSCCCVDTFFPSLFAHTSIWHWIIFICFRCEENWMADTFTVLYLVRACEICGSLRLDVDARRRRMWFSIYLFISRGMRKNSFSQRFCADYSFRIYYYLYNVERGLLHYCCWCCCSSIYSVVQMCIFMMQSIYGLGASI